MSTQPNVCAACNTTHPRLPMDDLTSAIYDAIFPGALQWSEDEDCGMNTLMREVAVTAAGAVRPAAFAPADRGDGAEQNAGTAEHPYSPDFGVGCADCDKPLSAHRTMYDASLANLRMFGEFPIIDNPNYSAAARGDGEQMMDEEIASVLNKTTVEVSVSDYTPTTGEVREGYATHRFNAYAKFREVSLPEFDRWLAAHDAEVIEKFLELADARVAQSGQPVGHACKSAEYGPTECSWHGGYDEAMRQWTNALTSARRAAARGDGEQA